MNFIDIERDHLCPICSTLLLKQGPHYSLNDLFKLWEPIQFSKETIEEHWNQSAYTQMYSCPECKLGIFLPQIIGAPNFYIELQKKTSDSYYVGDKWDFEEALNDAKKFESIIEIGCGPANFLEKIKPYVNRIYGVEYNELALQIARSKGFEVFGMNEDLSQIKGHVDAAFSFHVLEHVANPVGFVQELCSFIGPDGYIGLSVPNTDGPVKYINPCIMNMPPHHATRWKLLTFKILAEKLGLKIERVEYEPLNARDCYYYSYYWINYLFHGKSSVVPALQFISSKLFNLLFRILAMFNKKELYLLKGQSIFILMSKKGDK